MITFLLWTHQILFFFLIRTHQSNHADIFIVLSDCLEWARVQILNSIFWLVSSSLFWRLLLRFFLVLLDLQLFKVFTFLIRHLVRGGDLVEFITLCTRLASTGEAVSFPEDISFSLSVSHLNQAFMNDWDQLVLDDRIHYLTLNDSHHYLLFTYCIVYYIKN